MRRRSLWFAAMAAAGALALTGCSGNAGISALDRAATPNDTLPAHVNYSGDVDLQSNRLLVEHDGLQYFAAQNKDKNRACLAIVEVSGEDWMASCGENNPSYSYGTSYAAKMAITVNFAMDDNDPELLKADGWTMLHRNVFIRE